MIQLTQPLDLDPTFQKLITTFGDGRRFTMAEVGKVISTGSTQARRILREIDEALTYVPEGPQLTVRRGTPANGGGYSFTA